MASAYMVDGAPNFEPPVHFDLGTLPHDARQTTGMTSIIVEPKEDIIPEWPTHNPSTSEAASITMLIRRNTPTKTKSILITPSKRDSLSPSLLSSSRTSSSSCTPADATTETTPERASSTESLKRNTMIVPVKRASTQTSESCEEGDEKTLKEQRLNVKFAPLPDLGPRKRRGIPLGVAARSRLVRRRRALVTDGGPQQYVVSTPMWTDEEMEEQRERLARAWEKEREGREYYSEVDENGEPYEDPFVTLGKIMKDAGRQLWQRMSSREGKENSKSIKGEVKKGNGKEDDKAEANDTEELDSSQLAQQLDASSQPAPSEIDPTLLPTEKERVVPSGHERNDDGTFSWEEVAGKELPSPPDDAVTRKKNIWSRMRTQSKPREALPTSSKSSARRSFVRSLRGRSMERSNDDADGGVKPKDKDKSVSLGLRRSLSF